MTHVPPWPEVVEGFLLFVVEDAFRKVAPKTADCYVSHVLKLLEHLGLWTIRVYTALTRVHLAKTPYRIRARIPFTCRSFCGRLSTLIASMKTPLCAACSKPPSLLDTRSLCVQESTKVPPELRRRSLSTRWHNVC
jgi:hypothetical protein